MELGHRKTTEVRNTETRKKTSRAQSIGNDICPLVTLTPRAKPEGIWRWVGGRVQKENVSIGTQVPGMTQLI